MKTQWYADLPKDKQEDFKKMVTGSKIVLDKAVQIVYNMNKTGKDADYDSPSWAYKQADTIGYNRALKDIISLLTVEG